MTVYYGSSVANGTITTACTMSTTTGGTETSKLSTWSGGNHFAEVWSQGGSSTPATSIPATPTGHGWVSTAPGAGTFAANSWSASVTVSYAATDTGNTLTIRFFKYSSGTYTSIGTITATSNTTAKTTVSFTSTNMASSTTFGSTDLLYTDLWLTDTTGAGGDNATIYESNSATTGVVNDVQITTGTFTPSSTHRLICDGYGGVFS